jgi:hypothetical protein
MYINSEVSLEVKSTLSSEYAFGQAQAEWIFFNNHNDDLQPLSQLLLETATELSKQETDSYCLAARNWGCLECNSNKSKIGIYSTFKKWVNYKFQGGLLISDQHDGSLVALAMNLKTKKEIRCRYLCCGKN